MDFVAHVRGNGDRQSLCDHLKGVAARSSENSAKLGLKISGALLGLLHDLGKYSADFQNYLKSAAGIYDQDVDEDYVVAASLKGKIDHSTAGAQLVWQELGGKGPAESLLAQLLAICVSSPRQRGAWMKRCSFSARNAVPASLPATGSVD